MSPFQLYDANVAKVLHSPSKGDTVMVTTSVSTLKVPDDFTPLSITMMEAFLDSKDEELCRTKFVIQAFQRKWDAFGFKAFLIRFMLFVS